MKAEHCGPQLLAYCKRDTLALVEVHRALARLVVPETSYDEELPHLVSQSRFSVSGSKFQNFGKWA